ncbi:MAG: potassium transporter KefB [Leadbetterella sp.]|nr:potassium transporter KefB [Leadbetterella sp.]
MIKTVNSRAVVLKAAAGGWLTGLCLICLFVLGVKDADPGWGSYWQIRPLLLTPLIAGAGAGFAGFLFARRKGSSFHQVFFALLAVAVFLFSLWIGIILGLSGTLWN